MSQPTLLEQLSVSACTDKNDEAMLATVINTIGQEEVTADMTFAVAVPIPAQSMVKPLRPQSAIIGDEQQHRLFELVHIMPPCPR